MRESGARIESNGQSYIVRKSSCEAVDWGNGVMACAFELADVSLRERHANATLEGLTESIPENRWEHNFKYLYFGRPENAEEPFLYFWRVADTCEPFEVNIQGVKIDHRDMVRRGLQQVLEENNVELWRLKNK